MARSASGGTAISNAFAAQNRSGKCWPTLAASTFSISARPCTTSLKKSLAPKILKCSWRDRPPARLHHEKAEAIAKHKEGERLNRQWQQLQRGGATEPAGHFTRRQLEVLDSYDSGELLRLRNNAILAVGHGRLRNARGETMDIGGSTGGGPRRILDSWHPPDWRQFLEGEGQR